MTIVAERPREAVSPPGYSCGMAMPKRRVSVMLDEDLVAELKTADGTLSAQVNEAIRAQIERRRRNRLLGEYLAFLDAKYGPVDKELVEEFKDLL